MLCFILDVPVCDTNQRGVTFSKPSQAHNSSSYTDNFLPAETSILYRVLSINYDTYTCVIHFRSCRKRFAPSPFVPVRIYRRQKMYPPQIRDGGHFFRAAKRHGGDILFRVFRKATKYIIAPNKYVCHQFVTRRRFRL